MKSMLPAMALLVSLGSILSCKQHTPAKQQDTSTVTRQMPASLSKPSVALKRAGAPSDATNPFDRYLADAKTNWPEPALARFANECGVNIDAAVPRFAQRPQEKWKFVSDLSHALDDQETDFYGTLEVWHEGDRVMAEEWGMELDTGDYYRIFSCLQNGKTIAAESVSWKLQVHDESSKNTGWGYVSKWKLGSDGKLAPATHGFLDLRENPISEPAMDADTKESLRQIGRVPGTWSEWKYPDRML